MMENNNINQKTTENKLELRDKTFVKQMGVFTLSMGLILMVIALLIIGW